MIERRRILGGAWMILLLSSLALAQPAETPSVPPPPPEAMAAAFMAGLVDTLGLTEDQVPRVEEVVTEMMRRQREIVGTYTGEGERLDQASLRTLQEELRRSQQQAHDDLSDALSEEQLAGFDDAVQQQRARAAGEAIVMRLRVPLGLTDEQGERLAPIFAESIRARGEMMREIRGQGRSFGAMRVMRTKMQEMQKELEDRLRPVLTDEQMKSYLEIAEQTRSRMRERAGDQPRR